MRGSNARLAGLSQSRRYRHGDRPDVVAVADDLGIATLLDAPLAIALIVGQRLFEAKCRRRRGGRAQAFHRKRLSAIASERRFYFYPHFRVVACCRELSFERRLVEPDDNRAG